MKTKLLTQLLTLLIALSSILPTATVAHAETNAPNDTPQLVVGEMIQQWTMGNGRIYWGDTCLGDEEGEFAELRRRPVDSNIRRVLQTIRQRGKCDTYQALFSSTDGVYYYNSSENRIERMALDAPYATSEVEKVNTEQTPIELFEANGYLYWTTPFAILRARKDGSGAIQTVANTLLNPSGPVFVGNTLYWADYTGVRKTHVNCATLPCVANPEVIIPFATGISGGGLVYQPISGGNPLVDYRLYWRQGSAFKPYNHVIRYCTFGRDTTCAEPKPTASGVEEGQATVAPVTFYTAAANWYIGPPVQVDGKLYWAELTNLPTNNMLTGEIKRRAHDSTAPVTSAETIATNLANLSNRLYVAGNQLYFARTFTGNQGGIYSLALGATVIERDFAALAIEVTQGIQNLANDAPLITFKPTVVRAYGKLLTGPSVPGVEVLLHASRDGVALAGSPRRPVNAMRPINSGYDFNRSFLDDGWYFYLPYEWTIGTITFELEIDPRGLHTDPNRANNRVATGALTFVESAPVCVVTVPVRTHTSLPRLTDPNVSKMIDQFTRRWPTPRTYTFPESKPIEELEICWYGPFPYPCWRPLELDQGWDWDNIPDSDWVIISLWKRRTLSFDPILCSGYNSPVHYMGLVHPDAPTDGNGYASLYSNDSWVQLPDHDPALYTDAWNTMRHGGTMAQELAHNYGRTHVDCGSPDNIDTNYPYSPCHLAPSGRDSYYGFDLPSLSPIAPISASDFMSYGSNRWVSDYTWRAILANLTSVQMQAVAPQRAAAGDSLLIAGAVEDVSKQGFLSTVYAIPNATLPPVRSAVQAAEHNHEATPHTHYRIRLYDAAGSLLLEKTLTIDYADDHDPAINSGYFVETIPAPATQIAKIELLADTTVIDTLQPGTAKPTITLQQPAAAAVIDENLVIQWTANDADANDRLFFTVQYSYNNGAHWHTLISDFPGSNTPTTTLSLNEMGAIRGSNGQSALIRVLASDGINTAIATSPAFTLNDRTPTATIHTPAIGETQPVEQAVILSGSALDMEDGELTGSKLQWQIDGVEVGSGTEVIVQSLAAGTHTAQLHATDSVSNSTAVSHTFTLAPLSIPSINTPTLDGHCNDEVYANASGVQLPPYTDGTQATVWLGHDTTDLWVCFGGLKTGAQTLSVLAGLRIDANNSGDAQMQSDDLGIFVREDGDLFALAGDGAGAALSAELDGVAAQVSGVGNIWNSEFRIAGSRVGGLDHAIRLRLEHFWANTQGVEYRWPQSSAKLSPQSWSLAVMGRQPVITNVDPATVPVNSNPITMTVSGSGFVSTTQVLWNDTVLPTTFVNATTLVAEVAATQLRTAGKATVKSRNALSGTLQSNSMSVMVSALPPVISTLTPDSTATGSPAMSITVNGSNFASDAQILWNGEPLPTTVVDAGQVVAQVDAAKLVVGEYVGVSVRNPSLDSQSNESRIFSVLAPGQSRPSRLFMPVVAR